jgi:hypothetical protein
VHVVEGRPWADGDVGHAIATLDRWRVNGLQDVSELAGWTGIDVHAAGATRCRQGCVESRH